MANTLPSIFDVLKHQYPPLVDVSALSEILSVQPQTIRNELSSGAFPIPSLKVGRGRRFRLIDVAIFIDGQMSGAMIRRRGRPRKALSLPGKDGQVGGAA